MFWERLVVLLFFSPLLFILFQQSVFSFLFSISLSCLPLDIPFLFSPFLDCTKHIIFLCLLSAPCLLQSASLLPVENHTSWWVMFTQMLQEGGMPEYLEQKTCKREGEWKKRKETCAELQLLEVFLLMLFDDKCLNQRAFTVTGV